MISRYADPAVMDDLAVAEADTKQIASAVLAELVRQGRAPAKEFIYVTVDAQQVVSYGVTGQPSFKLLGKTSYDRGSDQLKYDPPETPKHAAAPAAPKVPTQEELCKEQWSQCADNEQLANNYKGWSDAQASCKSAADDLAKYGTPDWGGWLHMAFGTYLKGTDYVKTGVAVLIDQDVKFQNAFGAMARSEVRCKYDLRTEKILDVKVTPR